MTTKKDRPKKTPKVPTKKTAAHIEALHLAKEAKQAKLLAAKLDSDAVHGLGVKLADMEKRLQAIESPDWRIR